MSIKRSLNIIEVSDPCSTYIASGCRYLVVSSYKQARYSEYIRLRQSSYSAYSKAKMPSVAEWESLEKKRRYLKEEEEEAIIKILRLRK
jgi:hypothetical protein